MLFIRCPLNLCKFQANIIMLRPSSISTVNRQFLVFVVCLVWFISQAQTHECLFLNIFGNYFHLVRCCFMHPISGRLGHSFTHTLRFDLISVQITTLVINEIISCIHSCLQFWEILAHFFLSVTITSKLILQIIAHNTCAQLLTIIHNILFNIVHNILHRCKTAFTHNDILKIFCKYTEVLNFKNI